MRYLPHTPDQIREMLAVVGAPSLDSLFESIPDSARFSGKLNVGDGKSEPQLMRDLTDRAKRNLGIEKLSFLGAGAYAHHIPPSVDQLLLRSEFYTAYTPYQPEVAQGTLQAIWEFQTITSELLGLPVANASMYDGASAAAEGIQMARRLTKRDRVVISECVHPHYVEVIRTYLSGGGSTESQELQLIPTLSDGSTDLAALEACLTEDVAACIVGYPNFLGTIVPLDKLAAAAHGVGALLVSSTTEPYALGVLKSPGSQGVDIATGEGQALATPPSFGGPLVGIFATRQDRKYLQQIPGRLCGETVDQSGKRGFVLTLATREQHIRRERATSNICTNQGLIALALTIRVSLLGKSGFEETAKACLSKSEYLKKALNSLQGCSLLSNQPTFNEFAVRLHDHTASAVCKRLSEEGLIPGLDVARLLPNAEGILLVAVTELHSVQDLDRLVEGIALATASS